MLLFIMIDTKPDLPDREVYMIYEYSLEKEGKPISWRMPNSELYMYLKYEVLRAGMVVVSEV